MINDPIAAHTRFMQAPWYGQKKMCFVGGLGSIGSWLALFLCRAGHNLILADYDKVEEVNLAGQLYPLSSIGDPKSVALAKVLTTFCDIEAANQHIHVYYQDASTTSFFSDIVFSCFDNIAIRRVLYDRWRTFVELNPTRQSKAILIDGRLAAETYEVFMCRYNPKDMACYEKTLFDPSETAPEICSYKATTHVSAAIAADMIRVFNNHLANLYTNSKIRNVPNYIFNESLLMTSIYE